MPYFYVNVQPSAAQTNSNLKSKIRKRKTHIVLLYLYCNQILFRYHRVFASNDGFIFSFMGCIKKATNKCNRKISVVWSFRNQNSVAIFQFLLKPFGNLEMWIWFCVRTTYYGLIWHLCEFGAHFRCFFFFFVTNIDDLWLFAIIFEA